MKHDQATPNSGARSRVFEYVCAYKDVHDGNSPTVKQIAEACEYAHSYVRDILDSLELNGFIARPVTTPAGKRQHASIEVVGGRWARPEIRRKP